MNWVGRPSGVNETYARLPAAVKVLVYRNPKLTVLLEFAPGVACTRERDHGTARVLHYCDGVRDCLGSLWRQAAQGEVRRLDFRDLPA